MCGVMKGQYEYNLLISGLVSNDINSKIPNKCLKKCSIHLHNSTVDAIPDFKNGATEIYYRLNDGTSDLHYDTHFGQILDAFVSIVGGKYEIVNKTDKTLLEDNAGYIIKRKKTEKAVLNQIIADYNLKSIAKLIYCDTKLDLEYEYVPGNILLSSPVLKASKNQKTDKITISDSGTGAIYEIVGGKIMIKDMNIP